MFWEKRDNSEASHKLEDKQHVTHTSATNFIPAGAWGARLGTGVGELVYFCHNLE